VRARFAVLGVTPVDTARTRPAASVRARFAVTGLILSGWVVAGCGVQQRAAESLIDPRLRSEGVLVERQQGVRDLELGRYRVSEIELEDEPFDGSGPLAPDVDGRSRPTQQLRLGFSLVGGTLAWTARCVGQRRQPPDHELAAVSGDPRDEIAVRCVLVGDGQDSGQDSGQARAWTLELDGDLGSNLLGRLYATAQPERPAKVVEVLLWHRLWNISRRRLPAALALIRSEGESADAGTEAALILDKPERAWLDPSLDDADRELALTAMLALRLLPLGFE
jgi:hypothetical protein